MEHGQYRGAGRGPPETGLQGLAARPGPGLTPVSFTTSDREYTLRSLDDAALLRRRLETGPKVTVIGGGPLGMEVADGDETPVVVKGDLAERSAVLHWPEQGSAAALNIRMPIPRLHKLAKSQPAGL